MSDQTAMTPASADDDRLRFQVTFEAEWPKHTIATGDRVVELFGDAVGDYDEYHEKEMRTPAMSMSADPDKVETDILHGIEFEDFGPMAWVRISTSGIRFVLDGLGDVKEAHEALAELYDENADDTVRELVGFPRLRSFKSNGLMVIPDDGYALMTDPTRNTRRKHITETGLVPVDEMPDGDRGLAEVGRWDVDYSVTDDGRAKLAFDHRDSITVVLAEEAAEVAEAFLDTGLLVVAVDEEDAD